MTCWSYKKYGGPIPVEYNKLWKIHEARKKLVMVDYNCKNSYQCASESWENEDVRVGVVGRICEILECKSDDLADIA